MWSAVCALYHSCTSQTDIEAEFPQRLIFALADSTRSVRVSNFVYSVQACGDYIHLTSGFYSVMVSELHRLRVHAVVSYIERQPPAALTHSCAHLMLNYSLYPIFTLLHPRRRTLVSKGLQVAHGTTCVCWRH